jgi:hypothetical protein
MLIDRRRPACVLEKAPVPSEDPAVRQREERAQKEALLRSLEASLPALEAQSQQQGLGAARTLAIKQELSTTKGRIETLRLELSPVAA